MKKSLSDDVENYVLSIPKAMQNYKKFLIRDKNIVNTDALVDQTMNYGIKMLFAGIGTTVTFEKAAELFHEQSIFCEILEDFCKNS